MTQNYHLIQFKDFSEVIIENVYDNNVKFKWLNLLIILEGKEIEF